jgi:hypothetical protein
MGFLRKLISNRDNPAPAWADMMRGDEARDFISLVESDLRRRGLDFQIRDGFVTAHIRGQAEPQELGLSNLVQLCHHNDRSDWSRVIAGHFDGILAITSRNLDALAADFEQVRPLLRVRLFPDESVGGVDLSASVTRVVAPGIQAVLVFDFPDSTSSVKREFVDSWGRSIDELFELGLENLGLEPPPLVEDVTNDSRRLRMWYGDSFYVATRSLRLEALVPNDISDVIVAVPNRHTLLGHFPLGPATPEVMSTMFQLAIRFHRDGPGSISPFPYWWHEGSLTLIPHRKEGAQTVVEPPQEFIVVLEAALTGIADA